MIIRLFLFLKSKFEPLEYELFCICIYRKKGL